MDASKPPSDRRRPDSQFQGLVEHTLVGMAVFQDGRFLYVNPKYCEIFGYSRAELLDHLTPLDLVADSERSLAAVRMEQLLTSSAPATKSVLKKKRKDGSIIDVEVHSTVMEINGRPALIASLMDVTERRRSQELVTRERDAAQRYLDIAGVMILVLNADATVARINRRGCEILGYDGPEEILGKSWIDCFVPERMREEMRGGFNRLYGGEDPGMASYENPVLTRTGDERIVAWHNALIRDDKGAVIATLSSGEDVTEQRRLVESLRLSEARFHTLFEEAPDAILVHDLGQGRFIDANRKAEELFECDREELLRLGPQHFYPPEQPDTRPAEESFAEHARRAVRGEEVRFERRIRTAKGKDRICEVQVTSLAYQGRRLARASYVDISERKRAERALKRTARTLMTLSQANAALVRATSQEGLFQEMCRVIVEVGGYRMAWIGFAEQDADKSVRPIARAGHDEGYLDLLHLSWADNERGRTPVGIAIRTGSLQLNKDVASDPLITYLRAEALKRGYKSSIALPLREAGRVFGAIAIYAAEPDAFGDEEVMLLSELAGDLSFGVMGLRTRAEREDARERLERAMEETVAVVANTIEMRDAYTAGHQRRVTRIAEAIAVELGLNDERIHGLRLASKIHDLGKIHVPAEILSKSGKLTPFEFELIKTHPQVGYEILKQVAFPWPIAEMVLQHHERLDGSGYPQGLKGDAILLEARIIAVADVVESMMSHRPYRAALGIDSALAEIEQGKGRLYDNAAVDACVKLFRVDNFKFD